MKSIKCKAIAIVLVIVSVLSPFTSAVYAEDVQTDWNVYSSTYFYYQMRSREQKKLYRNLRDEAARIMESTDTVAEIRVPYSGIDDQIVNDILYIWLKSERQYFYLADDYGTSDGTAFIKVKKEYQNGADRSRAREDFLKTISSYADAASGISNDILKERAVHDAIIRKLSRKSDKTGGEYSAAFSIVMNYLGIPTVIMTAEDSHEWNEICIDDSWYNVDVSWDDNDKKFPKYRYFDLTETQFSEKVKESHTPRQIWKDHGYPLCTKNLVKKGDPFDIAIDDMKKAGKNPGRETVSIYYTTVEYNDKGDKRDRVRVPVVTL